MASSGRFELCNSILPYASYNRIIKTSIVKLGLDPKLFGTHSCRAGGASDLAPKVSELELLVSGRWADPRSIRHYVEIGQEDRFRLNSLAQFGASADSTPKNSNVLSIKEVSGETPGPQESNLLAVSKFWGGSNALKNKNDSGRDKIPVRSLRH